MPHGSTKRARHHPRARVVLLAAIAAVAGCAGKTVEREITTFSDLAGAVTEAIVERYPALPSCATVAIDVEERVATLGPLLAALDDSVAARLRRRGVRCYPLAEPPGVTRRILLITDAEAPVAILRVREIGANEDLARFRLPPSSRAYPPELAGRRIVFGPRISEAVLELWALEDGTVAAQTRDELLVLEIAEANGTLAIETTRRPSGALARSGPARTPAPDGGFFLRALPGELERVPLVGYAGTGTAYGRFAALDRWGRLWYGIGRELWGPPRPGFGSGISALDEGYVSASNLPSGAGEALVHFEVQRESGVIDRARVGLGRAPVLGLAVVDVNGDGVSDVVVARRAGVGSRIDAFVSGEDRTP